MPHELSMQTASCIVVLGMNLAGTILTACDFLGKCRLVMQLKAAVHSADTTAKTSGEGSPTSSGSISISSILMVASFAVAVGSILLIPLMTS